MLTIRLLLAVLVLQVTALASDSSAQADHDRIVQLEQRASNLEREMRNAGDTGLVLMLFGAFCALWAQNTGRSPWLWFFLGAFFSAITVVVLLVKNSDDRFNRQQRDRYTHGRT